MPKKYKNLSPFAQWLVKLAEKRDLTLSAVAHQSGLGLVKAGSTGSYIAPLTIKPWMSRSGVPTPP